MTRLVKSKISAKETKRWSCNYEKGERKEHDLMENLIYDRGV